MNETLYQLNPALRIQAFDEAAALPRWLYELDDAAGRVQRLLVSQAMHRVLKAFDQPRPLAWSPAQLHAAGWTASDEPMLRQLLDERCLPSRLLVAQGVSASDSCLAPAQARRPSYMSLMLPVLGANAVARIASRLQRLFHPRAMIAGVAVGVLSLLTLLVVLSGEPRFATLASRDVLLAVGLGAFGVLLHELGHAAAAWRCGARSVSIGVGWYVCFPVAYAELSETWRMTRQQRALIDVAGIHLQALWVAALIGWHLIFGQAAVLVAASAGALSILWNMNPLLRMDGYWLVSDLLGIANLRETAKSELADFLRRRRGMPVAPSRFGPRTRMAVVAYAVMSTLFFALMIVAASRHFGEAAVHAIPQLAQRVWNSDWAHMGAADRWVLGGGFLWQVFMLVVLGRFLQLTLQRGWRRRSALRRPR
jgi:putative peptide zinc metalloprotease protein